MKIDTIDVDGAIGNVKRLLREEPDLSPALKSALEILLLISVLLGRVALNSKNSSKPPSSDPNRNKTSRTKSDKPSGGQNGHIGTTLTKIPDPDEIELIMVDRQSLPEGNYREVGFETRQVFDIDISRLVIEYRAQILEDTQGKRFIAPFPDGITKAVQYGDRLKAHAVYLSQYQLLPYKRVQEYFAQALQIPVSEGSLYNFNCQAFEQLARFERHVKDRLACAQIAHADETGINIDGKGHWLHCTSNKEWTHYFAHEKRGTHAMDEAGILPRFNGILCHDHWRPYFSYDVTHALCNAHHLRELVYAWEQDNQVWARDMRELLKEINSAVDAAGGALGHDGAERYRKRYKTLLKEAEIECPPPEKPPGKVKRGRVKRSKSRNLLERLINHEEDVLRFMENPLVPFTNNQGENDIRMTKVQQKISGCFRSQEGAQIFCRIRGYLSTCRKQGISSSHAMTLVFEGKLPDFVQRAGWVSLDSKARSLGDKPL
ncbi:MAG: IS66 family transposase [Actinomycetota bacterium]|nr:IS66 family transposase [Actinomycetota bacterium]